VLVDRTPIDSLDFASPVAGLGGKIGLDATTKGRGESEREWGRPIVADPAVTARVASVIDAIATAGRDRALS
jgi:4-hydroxy-3-polyprenylbenzoate decarboxylase